MKPTRREIEDAWFTSHGAALGFDAIMEVIDRARETEASEYRSLVEAMTRYGRHLDWCEQRHGAPCSCGFDGVLSSVSGNVPPLSSQADLPSVDVMVGILSDARLADDVERHNELQRARREAYEHGAREHDDGTHGGPDVSFDGWLQSVRAMAARRYPLKKRVPKVIPDPHGAGEWSTRMGVETAMCAVYRPRTATSFSAMVPVGIILSPKRIAAIQQMFSDPWAWGESTEVEP